MKKLFLLVMGIVVIGGTSVLAVEDLEGNDRGQSKEILEESFPIRDDDGMLVGLDCFITIPNDYQDDTLTISPDLFGGIREYKDIHKDDDIFIRLVIINHSNYNYHYILDSFYLGTDTFNEEYEFTNAKGFDGKSVMSEFVLYRTFNEAIGKLFGYSSYCDYKDVDLSDHSLDLKLKEFGYSGIDELDQYYLDFYNDKYLKQEDVLSHFEKSTIKEIFGGQLSFHKETNPEVIALGYENFYHNVLLFRFFGEADYKSLENYMVNNDDQYLRDNGSLPSGEKLTLRMNLKIDSDYYTDVYSTYHYFGKFLFQMTRDEEVVFPPKTGV